MHIHLLAWPGDICCRVCCCRPDRNHDGMLHDAAASKSVFARKTHGKPSASCGNSDTKKNQNLDNLDCPYSPYSHTGSSLHLASHAHTHAKSQNNIPRGYSGTYCFALPWHARLRRRLFECPYLTSGTCSFATTLQIRISSENLGMIG